MKKNFSTIFCVFCSVVISLVLMSPVNSTDDNKKIESETNSKNLDSEVKDKITRRSFNWQNLQHFLDSFKDEKENKIKFIDNTKNKKILIVGGGLKFDNEVEINSITKRARFYPLNTYLVDIDKQYIPDEVVDIRKESAVSKEANIFDVVIFEHLHFSALTLRAFKNALRLLKPGGKLIFNFPPLYKKLPLKSMEFNPKKYAHASIFVGEYMSTQDLYFYKKPAGDTELMFTVYLKSSGDEESDNNKKIDLFDDKNAHYDEIFSAFKDEILNKIKLVGFETVVAKDKNSINGEEWYASGPSRGLIICTKK